MRQCPSYSSSSADEEEGDSSSLGGAGQRLRSGLSGTEGGGLFFELLRQAPLEDAELVREWWRGHQSWHGHTVDGATLTQAHTNTVKKGCGAGGRTVCSDAELVGA